MAVFIVSLDKQLLLAEVPSHIGAEQLNRSNVFENFDQVSMQPTWLYRRVDGLVSSRGSPEGGSRLLCIQKYAVPP